MKMTKAKILGVSIISIIVLIILVCYCIFSTKETGKEEKTTEEITTEKITTEEITTKEITTVTTEKVVTTEAVTTEEVTENSDISTDEEVYDEQNAFTFDEVSQPETIEQIASDTDAEETPTETETVVSADIPWIVYEVVECEAHGGDKESKIHIAHVIRNRVWSDSFADDYYTVCTSPNQFCWRSDVEQSTIDAVNEAMNMDDTTYGALFFHSMEWMDSWCGRDFKFTDNIGHHFY